MLYIILIPYCPFIKSLSSSPGDSARPESKEGVTVEVDGDLYNYNFHAAVAGFGGEYECDYTVGEQDPVYHVIVLLRESVTCPAGGSFPDESMVSSYLEVLNIF